MIIDHHEDNHYDIVHVIWFPVIDDTECNYSYINVEHGRGDMKLISGGSGKSFVILLNYKIAYHIEHIAKVWAKNDSMWFPYDHVCQNIWYC